MEGVQKLKLYAFYGDANEHQGEHLFTIEGESGEYGNDVLTEKPDKQGFFAQQMRFTNDMFTQTNKRQGEIDKVYQGMLGMLADENTKLRIENLDAIRIIKQLTLEKTEQEHKMKMEALAFERSSQERTQWLRLLPAITNSLTGREVFPVAASDTAIIEMVAENIKPEDLMKLMEIVPPQLQGILSQRFTQLLKEKEAVKREAQTAMVKISPTPEDNAAGD
jgi:regulator of replication initiation timing